MQPELELVLTPTDDARLLIEELEQELSGDFTPQQRHGYDVTRIFQPHILFFVARINGKAAGCGAIAFEVESAELKRMYVRPAYRGQQIGRAILARLETEARARAIQRMVLETGDTLLAAIHLYELSGFTRCPPFGPYLAMPPQSIERSVFMEKWLTK